MGGAVGRQLAQAGHDIVFGSRAPDRTRLQFSGLDRIAVESYVQAAARAPVVIVAVPWVFAIELIGSLREVLAGKIVIDLTNPLSPDISHLVVGGADSAAERIAAVVPSARVIKALNMITADNFPDPSFSGEVAQSLYCGDDEEGREAARQIIKACGYQPVYCGALTNARYIEAMAMFWLQLAFWEDWGPGFAIKLHNLPTTV